MLLSAWLWGPQMKNDGMIILNHFTVTGLSERQTIVTSEMMKRCKDIFIFWCNAHWTVIFIYKNIFLHSLVASNFQFLLFSGFSGFSGLNKINLFLTKIENHSLFAFFCLFINIKVYKYKKQITKLREGLRISLKCAAQLHYN